MLLDRVGSGVVDEGVASTVVLGWVGGAESVAQATAPAPKASAPRKAHTCRAAGFTVGLQFGGTSMGRLTGLRDQKPFPNRRRREGL